MNFSDIIAQKALSRDEIKWKLNLPKRSKILVWIYFNDSALSSEIISGLSILPANFVIFWDLNTSEEHKNISYIKELTSTHYNGLDALLCDCSDTKVERIMEEGVVPIINEKNYLWKILTEFHPGRAEGNAYLYEDNSLWAAYYALIRYLENHKFPYDNRNLVKNVLWV